MRNERRLKGLPRLSASQIDELVGTTLNGAYVEEIFKKDSRTNCRARCSCGVSYTRALIDLRRGSGKCADCVRHAANFRHGESDNYLYKIYTSMKSRCLNKQHPAYDRYGGRGIKIDTLWAEDYMSFKRDVGDRPSPKHSLDRINNEGNYTKENVRWATRREQQNNTRTNIFITYLNQTKTMAEWDNYLDLKKGTLKRKKDKISFLRNKILVKNMEFLNTL